MKAGWKTVKLTDVAELSGRIGWKGLTAKEYTQAGPYFLSVHSLNYGDFVDFRDAFHISQARYDESPEIMLQTGDVLICKDGAGIGKVGIVGELPGQTTINSSLLLIRATQKIEPKYLYYILMSPYFQAIVQSRLEGATTPHLYQRDIAGFPIHLPPLDEQRRIVAVLDKAFAGIATATANAQKNLTNARALFESYANDAFEELALAVVKRPALETLTEAKSGITYGVVKPGDMGSVPFVRGGDLIGGEVRLDRLRTITHEVSAQYNRTLLRGGELLMCLVGVPGQCAIAPPELDGANIARQVGLIRLRPEVNAEYVKDYLQSPPGQKSLGTFTGGSVQQVINLGDLRQVEIPLPDRPQQDEIVKRIAISKRLSGDLVKRFEAKLAALAEIKQSLLQKAFAGELT